MADRAPLQLQLLDVWTWLPAFRAVAEVQHVHLAARSLNITPSSLSRAIGLLEEHLGRSLFDRVGRNLRLNHDGEELLAAVRDGMRRIDDGLAKITERVFAGELRVACEGDHSIAFAWRTAARLIKRYPAVTIRVDRVSNTNEVGARLLRGDFDVALMTTLVATSRLAVDVIGPITCGVYCGVGHPLHRESKSTLKSIRSFPFVSSVGDVDGGAGDDWPAAWERTVVLKLPALQSVIAACQSGEFLAMLPDLAVSDARARGTLRKLRGPDVPSSTLYAIRRPNVSNTVDRAGAFIAEIREVSAQLTRKKGKRASR